MSKYSKRLDQLEKQIPTQATSEAVAILQKYDITPNGNAVYILTHKHHLSDDEIDLLESSFDVQAITFVYPDGTPADL